MKKVFFFFSFFLIIAGIGLFLYQFFFLNNEKGALQVTANPESKVYLNGKYIGNTPLCKCGQDGTNGKNEDKELVSSGAYTIRLVPIRGNYIDFQDAIVIGKSVLSVVDRKFLPGAMSEGSIIFLTPFTDQRQIGVYVASIPDGADVLLDSANVGKTPLTIGNITESDHELQISKEGYKTKDIRIRTTIGYKLTAKVFLGIDPAVVTSKEASSEATLTPTLGVMKVEILETGTGFLRVRDNNSLGGKEIERVNPGESYELIEEQPGWYQIKLKDGTLGWISSQFAKKLE